MKRTAVKSAICVAPRDCRCGLIILLLLPLKGNVAAQARSTSTVPVFSIRLEQEKADTIKTVPPNSVFLNGELLRFRITSQIDGYLYVVDRGTSGTSVMLFPELGAPGADDHVSANRTYLLTVA